MPVVEFRFGLHVACADCAGKGHIAGSVTRRMLPCVRCKAEGFVPLRVTLAQMQALIAGTAHVHSELGRYRVLRPDGSAV